MSEYADDWSFYMEEERDPYEPAQGQVTEIDGVPECYTTVLGATACKFYGLNPRRCDRSCSEMLD
jgi:hypothetical protein